MMAKEIERKFLVEVSGLPSVLEGEVIKQGYLSHQPEKVVRIRCYGPQGFLTVKSKSVSIARDEFEYAIPLEDAEQMLMLCENGVIHKKRYRIEFRGFTWELDQFFDDNEGLWLAEIELDSESQYFEVPSWVRQEVSGDKRYFNSYLSKYPFKTW